MKKLFTLLFFLSSAYLFAQNTPTMILDEKSNNQILIGKCSRADFKKVPYQEDYNFEYPIYIANDTAINLLKDKMGNVTIKIIMGCWCGDSKEQVPRFLKIMDLLKIEEKNLEIFCVNRDKKVDGLDISNLNIEKVPTFIIYRNGIEIGRIIETPLVSLEKDLFQIVLK